MKLKSIGKLFDSNRNINSENLQFDLNILVKYFDVNKLTLSIGTSFFKNISSDQTIDRPSIY